MNYMSPWKEPPLNQWSICSMNHYHVNGEKCLLVSMIKDGKCITEKGRDDEYLWMRLCSKAMTHLATELKLS